MSTTLNTPQVTYGSNFENFKHDLQYQFDSYNSTNIQGIKSHYGEEKEENKGVENKKFREAPAKYKDNKNKFNEAPAKAKDFDQSKTRFDEAPAQFRDHKTDFTPAPAKVRDHGINNDDPKDISEGKGPSKDSNSVKTENHSTKNVDSNINEISEGEKQNIEKSNEEAKKSKVDVNTNGEDIIQSDPSFILKRFRMGDPELFKLLSDPALGPILMAKIQDAAAAETRIHTLLSNLQKAKDDTLKAIVNNIR
ncbi:MAG: hypothetical protein N2746_06410 [Deltaproteobacteria bacterium]|nr:hypothetical protein [Deltaproteobacteria bacterium]